ncbi:MAG: phosphatase PAP2 family protein [Rubricoccaceae bacterium]
MSAGSPDVRLLRLVYAAEAPAFEGWMRQVNAGAYPVYAAAAPALAAGALARGESLRPAARMVLAEGTATLSAVVLKRVVARPRPYTVLEGIASRDAGTRRDPDRASFPSGHTALAFAVATSASLSYPEWYVAVPAFAWAASAGLARVWHGVHYPSDVLAGALLGSAAAVAAGRALPDQASSSEAAPLLLRLRVAL